MIKNSLLYSISPTYIYHGELYNSEVIKEVFFDNFEKYGFEVKVENYDSNLPQMPVGFGQSDSNYPTGEVRLDKGYIHLDDNFSLFFTQLKSHITKFLDGIGLNVDKLSYHVLKSWYTIMDEKWGVALHHHNSSELSFVYYINVPPGAGNIHFLNPNFVETSHNCFFPSVYEKSLLGRGFVKDEITLHTKRLLPVEVKDGDLLIFPSTLAHEVPASKSENGEKRYSISGDIKLTTSPDISTYEHGLVHPSRWLEL